jgi:thiamine-phosphate diphosphorylase
MPLARLHLVTDDATLAESRFHHAAEAVLERGGSGVVMHLRGHATGGRALHDHAIRLAGAALRTGAWLLVNDRVDVAMAARANGVQLGHRSIGVADARALLGHGARIGYSAHAALEAGRAAAEGADFIVAGTIYATPSHPEAAGAGLQRIRDCASASGLPVLAIGGVSPERVPAVAAAGAWGVAVLGGVWRASDPAAAAGAYLERIRQVYGGGDAAQGGQA